MAEAGAAAADDRAKRRKLDPHRGKVANFRPFRADEWDLSTSTQVRPATSPLRRSPELHAAGTPESAAADNPPAVSIAPHATAAPRDSVQRSAIAPTTSGLTHAAAQAELEQPWLSPQLQQPDAAGGSHPRACAAVEARSPRGLWLARSFCGVSAAEAIYSALESDEAASKGWTGLKLDNRSMKTYTGTAPGLGMRGGRYSKVWGRRKPRQMTLLQGCPELVEARARVEAMVAEIKVADGAVLLTEQLINYEEDDLFFNLHW